MFIQVKFRIVNCSFDDVGVILGGIAHYDENNNLDYVICGCCGGTFEPEDIEIIKKYTWINLVDTIIGD